MSTEADLAKRGGYEWYASAPAAISFILYFVTMGLSMAVLDASLGMAFLLFIFAFVFIPISLYFSDVAYKECVRKGRELEEYESRRRNEAHKKQEIDYASQLHHKGGLANLQAACNIYSRYGYSVREISMEIAQAKERLLDYAGAIEDFKELGLHKDAKRVRRKMLDEKKVDQTVVQGDYVDDRDTIVKDSVVNRSNIGASSDDKIAKLEKIAEMKDKGIIDDDEFKQMKKEILGK